MSYFDRLHFFKACLADFYIFFLKGVEALHNSQLSCPQSLYLCETMSGKEKN